MRSLWSQENRLESTFCYTLFKSYDYAHLFKPAEDWVSYIQLMFHMAIILSRDFGIWPHGAIWRDHFHFEDSAPAPTSSAVNFAFHMINPALFPLALPRQPSHTPFLSQPALLPPLQTQFSTATPAAPRHLQRITMPFCLDAEAHKSNPTMPPHADKLTEEERTKWRKEWTHKQIALVNEARGTTSIERLSGKVSVLIFA